MGHSFRQGQRTEDAALSEDRHEQWSSAIPVLELPLSVLSRIMSAICQYCFRQLPTLKTILAKYEDHIFELYL